MVERNLNLIGWVLLLVAAAGLFAVGIATAFEVRWQFFTSDVLLPTAYVHDLFHHAWAAAWFELPRIPSIFPDLISIVLLSVAIPSWRVVSLCYGALSFAALVLTCGAVVARLSQRGLVPSIAMFLALAVLAMLIDLQFYAGIGAYFYILVPVIHSGSFLVALWGLLLVQRYIEQPTSRLGLAIVLLTVLGTLSDLIFIGVFAVPAMISAFLLRDGRWRAVAMLAITGCIAGIVLDRLVFRHLLFRQTDFPISIRQHLALLPAFLREGTVHFEAACAALVIIVPALLRKRSQAVRFWWVVAATTVVGTLMLLPLVYFDFAAIRYAQPIWWWALIMLGAAALRIAPRVAPWCAAGAAIVLVVIVDRSRADMFAPGLVTAWHHPVEGCVADLQRAGQIHAGIADYWVARPLEASSDWTLQVVQVTEKGRRYLWGNNRLYYAQSPDDPGRAPQFDYIVTMRLDEAAILERFGPPARVVPCADTAIWIYDDDRIQKSFAD